jgi:hypothetical protein
VGAAGGWKGTSTDTELMTLRIEVTLAAAVFAGLVAVACGQSQPSKPPIGALSPTAHTTPSPLALDDADTEFGGVLRLEAGRLLTPIVRQGESAKLELTWRLLRPASGDLQATVRLVDHDGRTRGRSDETIGGPGSGTSSWSPGGLGSEYLELQLPGSVPPGAYDLTVAVTDPAVGVEIPVSLEAGLPPVIVEREHVLGAIRVAPYGN